jgi:ComF family protein
MGSSLGQISPNTRATRSPPQTRRWLPGFGHGQQPGRWIRSAVNLVYPPRCVVCGDSLEASDSLICDRCRRVLVPAGQLQCRRCGADIGAALPDAVDCARCRREKYRFVRCVCLARFRDILREVVWRMKRRAEEPLTIEMGRLFCDVRRDELRSLQADVVVPIPMHWTRRLRRGVNSSELLAAGVAKSLDLPLAAKAIVRTRRTKRLAELTREERKRTLRDAFAVRRGCNFHSARVLLVDDVLTTGTTCDTAAKALRRAGAAAVFAAVIARAYPGD